jgi:hypothetical protein
MTMLYEAGTRRYFASDMNGKLFAISSDGKTVSPYLDLTATAWKVDVQAQGTERGLQSFAFHPQFNQAGARGFGKFYTYTDTSNMSVPGDFKPAIAARTHDIIVLEWTAKTPTAATYDGGAPRELIRIQEPYANHNGGHLTLIHSQHRPARTTVFCTWGWRTAAVAAIRMVTHRILASLLAKS